MTTNQLTTGVRSLNPADKRLLLAFFATSILALTLGVFYGAMTAAGRTGLFAIEEATSYKVVPLKNVCAICEADRSVGVVQPEMSRRVRRSARLTSSVFASRLACRHERRPYRLTACPPGCYCSSNRKGTSTPVCI